jgi:hypothetical protein
LSGEQRDDGTLARLPFSIQKACILGREKILIAQAEHTLRWLDDEEISDRCENPSACARACLEISRCIWKPMPDVSRGLEKWSDVKTDGCVGIVARMRKKYIKMGGRRCGRCFHLSLTFRTGKNLRVRVFMFYKPRTRSWFGL